VEYLPHYALVQIKDGLGVYVTVAAKRWESEDDQVGDIYVFDEENVRPLGMQLEGLMAGNLLRRQKIDTGYMAVHAVMPKLVQLEIDDDGRASSPWN
jgi:uncharacterized secreted protein with C-terminal beta-propeller domain